MSNKKALDKVNAINDLIDTIAKLDNKIDKLRSIQYLDEVTLFIKNGKPIAAPKVHYVEGYEVELSDDDISTIISRLRKDKERLNSTLDYYLKSVGQIEEQNNG